MKEPRYFVFNVTTRQILSRHSTKNGAKLALVGYENRWWMDTNSLLFDPYSFWE